MAPVSCSASLLGGGSQKFAERIGGETCVAHDSAHRERIDWIMPRNGEDSRSVRHHNVLTLPNYPEASFLQRSHREKVIDSLDFTQSLDLDGNVEFANIASFKKVIAYFEIFADCVTRIG